MTRIIILFLFIVSLGCSDALKDDEFSEFEDEFQTKEVRFDPLEGHNRVMTSFNDFAFTNTIEPITRAYKYVVAKEIRFFVSNFFDNLKSPMRFINNLLQGKIKNSGEELFRFTLNTTMGIGGLADPAKEIFKIEKHPEDFGQTLGFYGVGKGFPIVLPFFGPSNLRDTIGLVGDYFMHPKSYLDDTILSVGVSGYERINYLSFRLEDYKNFKKDAIDLYPFLQDFYENYRQQEILK